MSECGWFTFLAFAVGLAGLAMLILAVVCPESAALPVTSALAFLASSVVGLSSFYVGLNVNFSISKLMRKLH